MTDPMTEGAERGTPRYTVVSDHPDFTVHDTKYGVDLFPTPSGNRKGYCRAIPCRTAERIADALNRDESLTEALKVAGEALQQFADSKNWLREGVCDSRSPTIRSPICHSIISMWVETTSRQLLHNFCHTHLRTAGSAGSTRSPGSVSH